LFTNREALVLEIELDLELKVCTKGVTRPAGVAAIATDAMTAVGYL
jgi:hypothetical protein